jgi:N-carbamoylputrescine amidase
MAQMTMTTDMEENYQKALSYLDAARGSDLLFFPEIQMTPFFPQYERRNVDSYAMDLRDERILGLRECCAKNHLYASPNLYLQLGKDRFDASLWITPEGELQGIAKMVHIIQARNFCEKDYYTPSDDGFKVFDAPWGKVGIVICFDRHLPESIRTCALMGADLVIIPTANTKDEPMEMFEWELRVQAMQNNVFIAMCNRVGAEGDMRFSGESIVVDPNGDVVVKADDEERLVGVEIDLGKAKEIRKSRPYILTRRPKCYR